MESLAIRYSNNSILSDTSARKLIGSACYVEISSAMKTWELKDLEALVKDQAGQEQSGFFSRMARGVIPKDTSISELKKISLLKGKRCCIKKWRDHPFWDLLKTQPPTPLEIEKALTAVTGSKKKLIWVDYFLKDDPRNLRNDDRCRKVILEIAKPKSFNALLALVALSRESYEGNFIRPYLNASLVSLDIFPHVMMECPHLYIRWKELADKLTMLIWKPKKYRFNWYFNLDKKLDSLEERIQALDHQFRQKENHKLPPKDIIDRYN
jgi:hypothetical protein